MLANGNCPESDQRWTRSKFSTSPRVGCTSRRRSSFWVEPSSFGLCSCRRRRPFLPPSTNAPRKGHGPLEEIRDGRDRPFLLSGFYNYLAVSVPKHQGDRAYHGLMGTKIILAFIVFFLASVLVGRSARFEPLRRDRKKWLLITSSWPSSSWPFRVSCESAACRQWLAAKSRRESVKAAGLP